MPNKDFRFGISGSIQGVDLNQLLVTNPAATYFMRIASDAPELGLVTGDVVVVDRTAHPKPTDVVVLAEEGEAELKLARYQKAPEKTELWGTVSYLIRKAKA